MSHGSLLSAALSSLDDISVVLFDTEARIVEVHGRAIERQGYDAASLVDRLAADVVPAAVWAQIGPLYACALAGQSVTRDLASADGTAVYASTFSPVQDAEGRIVGGMVAARDVTAQHHAREALARFETSFEAAPTGMALVAPDGRFLRVNAALCRLLERSEPELLARDFQSLTHPDDLAADLELLRQTIAGARERYDLAKRYLAPDGTVIEAQLSVALVRDAAGRPAHLVAQVVDLTALEAARRELAAVNGRLQAILDHSPMAIYMRDLDQRWTMANPETCRIMGQEAQQLLGNRPQEHHPDTVTFAAHDREVLASGHPKSFDEPFPDARTGELHHYWTLKFPVRDADGEVVGVGGVSLDVTERERVSRELAAANDLFESVFANAPVGMAISAMRPDGTTAVVQCNEAFAAMSGRRPEELVGRSVADIIHPEDAPERVRAIAGLIAGRPFSGEMRFRHVDGHYVAALVAPSMTHGPDGERLFVIQALDISERKRFEAELQHLADHDALTGLLNRRRFEQELGREVERVRSTGRPAALVMLDLDGFKDVNDVFGHSAGDQLITRVGMALQGALRATDVLARIGGDEFAVIVPGTDPGGAAILARTLVEAVRGQGRIASGGRHAEVTASAGLTTLPAMLRADGEALLVEADIAMYQAKEAGRDRVVAYERADRRREHLTRQSDWIGRLRHAIKEERFLLLAQPVVQLFGRTPGREHFEMLVRLRDDNGELVPPAAFLPHAERNGLVTDIDRWVMGEAVRMLHAEQAAGRDIHLAINLSACTMQDPALADHLAALLAAHPVAERSLLIEITETAAITNVARAGELARQLRALGCRLALDDFGAGFASFYYLKHLVFDVLKIDGDFVEQLPRSTTDQLVVRAVVDIARGLGVQVIAERVQDAETVELLRMLGVDFGQGYHLGRPGPLPGRRVRDLRD